MLVLCWLVYKESDGMYCLICKRHCHCKAEIYCTKPATRYRKEAILDHVRSKNHKAAELEELVQKISPFEKDLQEKKQYADEVYDAAFKSMYWIAKEELPNNKFVSLINLIESTKNEPFQPQRNRIDQRNDGSYWRCNPRRPCTTGT